MTPARGRHFRALAGFLRRAEAKGPLAPAPDPPVSLAGARALALSGERAVAVWLHAPAAGYGTSVVGARIALRGLARGRWRVTWVDDSSGLDEARAELDAHGEDVLLEAPPFARHVAALVERVDGAEPAVRARLGR